MKKLLMITFLLVPSIANAQFESPYVNISSSSTVSHYDDPMLYPVHDNISCVVSVSIPVIYSWENYFVKIEIGAVDGSSGYSMIVFGSNDQSVNRSYPIFIQPGMEKCIISHSWRGYYIKVKLFYYSPDVGIVLVSSTGRDFGHPLHRTDDSPRVNIPFMGIQ
jgi:hypothetical protein